MTQDTDHAWCVGDITKVCLFSVVTTMNGNNSALQGTHAIGAKSVADIQT
jgi:hypothetical protein